MIKPQDLNIYYEMYKFEDIVIQSNIDGYYTKRIKVNMQELQTIKHNHRKIGINEVVFDIDCHLRVISNKIHDFISSNLIKDNISHQVWDTSRSPHIHAFFKDMNLYTQEVRRDIRLLILKNYSSKFFSWIDKSKASENNMIRDFGGLHEITGKPKTMIYEFFGNQKINLKSKDFNYEFQGLNSNVKTKPNVFSSEYPETLLPKSNMILESKNRGFLALNPIPATILEQLRVLYNQRQKSPDLSSNAVLSPLYKEELTQFISYCCENTHRHDGKERILFKNIAIACLLLELDSNARHRIYYEVVRNCNTKRHISELIQWDKFFQKQKRLRFSWREVTPYYDSKKSQFFDYKIQR